MSLKILFLIKMTKVMIFHIFDNNDLEFRMINQENFLYHFQLEMMFLKLNVEEIEVEKEVKKEVEVEKEEEVVVKELKQKKE